MPWGVLGVGKRPWKFGTALQYDGSDSLTTESISLTAPYGPFDIGIAYYPFRFAGRSGILGNTTPLNTPAYGDPYDLPGYIDPDDNTNKPSGQYYSRADRSGAFSNDFLVYLNYSIGPVSAGVLGAYGSYHIGPEANLRGPGAGYIHQRYSQSLCPWMRICSTGPYMKNTTMEGFFSIRNWRGYTGRIGSAVIQLREAAFCPCLLRGTLTFPAQPQTRYIEQLRAAIETGLMCGPAKISFLSVWTPGPDRRNGAYIDRQPAAFVRHPTL